MNNPGLVTRTRRLQMQRGLAVAVGLAALVGGAGCRPAESEGIPSVPVQVASRGAASDSSAPAAAPGEALVPPADGPPQDAGGATEGRVAPAAGCKSALAIAQEMLQGDSPPKALRPGFDVDGDGTKDPIFVAPISGPFGPVLVFVEKSGCGRLVGILHTNDPKFVRLIGRAPSGWAVLASSMPFTFDEVEEKLEYDGAKYVRWTRRRDYPLPPPGKPRIISPWSPWILSEAE